MQNRGIGGVVGISVALICLGVCGAGRCEDPSEPLEVDMVRRLLPVGDDTVDLRDDERKRELVALGERAYPGLVAWLEETKDRMVVGRILAIFPKLGGDRTLAVAAVKKLLRGEAGTRDRYVYIDGIECLAQIGEVRDCDAIVPLLRSEDQAVRINAARALGKLGDESTARRIEKELDLRRKLLGSEAYGKDLTVKEGLKAIKAIQERRAQSQGRE